MFIKRYRGVRSRPRGVKILLEKTLEEGMRKKIVELGGLCYKFTSPGNSGVPDRIVILPGGKIIFVELKKEDGRLSALQKNQIKKMRRRGAEVRVLYGKGDIDEFVKECENEIKTP